MTESEKLVWFEADGTRHVFDEAPSKTTDVAETDPASSPVDGPGDETPPTQTQVTDEPAQESVEKSAASEPAQESVEKPATSEPAPASAEEPSALRGMMRALALGAAAAAATGAAVGAISLAATGDRPDTTGETVPSTEIAQEEPVGSERPGTTEIGRVDLVPPTTTADQPG